MSYGKIIIGGDIFPRQNFELFKQGKIEEIYSQEIIKLFTNAEISVCNLEGVLTNYDKKTPKCGPSLKAPPETIAGIKNLGIDYLTLANNHAIDYGNEGFKDTVKILNDQNIGFFGAGEHINDIRTYVSVTIGDKKVIFYAVGETVFNIPSTTMAGINLYDEYRVCNELRELKKKCDLLIVLYHGGVEYFRFPTPWVKTRFHRMADSGADMVIAQHTHCIGTQEDYNGAYLLYGQGNFHFIQKNEKEMTQTGLLLEVDLNDCKFEVKPHLICQDGDKAVYDVKQDLADFYERNKRLAEGDDFKKEFSAYSEEWMIKWLLEFRGHTKIDKLMKKLLSKDRFVDYLRKRYSDHMVMRLLEHVRGEEDVEVMQQGILDFYYRDK